MRHHGVMLLAATDQTGLELISLAFIVAGFAACGALWYVMVFRGSRDERRDAEKKSAEDQARGAGRP